MKTKKIGVIDYGLGNLASVVNALRYLKYDVKIISKSEDSKLYTHLILPGVGSFKRGMEKLKQNSWDIVLKEYNNKQCGKILGICLGMQLLFSSGEEEGVTEGLNFFEGTCNKLKASTNYPIPHIGFNSVSHNGKGIWNGINQNCFLYFVHSFAIKDTNKKNKQIITNYGNENFISFIESDNIFGAQFHPEKSHVAGLKFLKNFIEQN
jgi:glutamine amidotransferase